MSVFKIQNIAIIIIFMQKEIFNQVYFDNKILYKNQNNNKSPDYYKSNIKGIKSQLNNKNFQSDYANDKSMSSINIFDILFYFYSNLFEKPIRSKINEFNNYLNGFYHFIDSSRRLIKNQGYYLFSDDYNGINSKNIKEDIGKRNRFQFNESLINEDFKMIKNRNLQIFNSTTSYNKTNCNDNAGVERIFIIGTYSCNQHTVTKEEYDKLKPNPNNNCTIVESEKTMCACSSNFEGTFCNIPISNFCGFSVLELNNINLLTNQNKFYNEYLTRKKIFLDDLPNINNNNKKLQFNLSFNCRLLPERTSNRVQLNNSTYVNFQSSKQFIIREKDGQDGNKENDYYKFEEYPSQNKEVIFRNKPENLIFEISFYNMNTLLKTINFEFNVENNEIFDLMLSKFNKTVMIDYLANRKIIEIGKVMGAIYYQINFKYNVTNKSQKDDYNKYLLRTFIYNGIIGVNKNAFLNFDYISSNGGRIIPQKISGWVILIITILVIILSLAGLKLYIYIKRKKYLDRNSDEMEKENSPIKSKNNNILIDKLDID